MRVKVYSSVSRHTEICTSIGWCRGGRTGELWSCGDDKALWKWNADGSPNAKIADLEVYPAMLQWAPSGDVLAIACTEGSLRLYTRAGKEDKKVEAHTGAVIALRWSHDGSALATAGEDGLLKIWSRSGMLRSTLLRLPASIYAVAWSGDNEKVAIGSYRRVVVQSLQPGRRPQEWKAHEGVVLQVDWSAVTSQILSGGEDCKYKIWDSDGRLLFTSAPLEQVTTSLAWSPNGRWFAVGSFGVIKLCDKTGWSYAREALTHSGSVFQLAWSEDSTVLAGACGSGQVVFSHLSDRVVSWAHLQATLKQDNTVEIKDTIAETTDDLDFRDRVIDMSVGHGALIVTTATQCSIHQSPHWSPPHVFDLKDLPLLVLQSPYHFCIVDRDGIHLYTYEGRLLSTVKYKGLRTDVLNPLTLSIARDAVCMVDASTPKCVRVFDVQSGRPLGQPIEHKIDIIQVAVNQHGSGADRRVAILDKNKDLYITPAHRTQWVKLSSMVDTFMWHDLTDMMVAICGGGDNSMHCWFYPAAVFVDQDLLPHTMTTKEAIGCGKMCQLVSFSGSHCTIRRSDGAYQALSVSPYPQLLYQQVEKGQWDKAIRVCRFVKSPPLWAALAAMALHARELTTAEIALASIDEVAKVHFITSLNELADDTVRAAELALFCKRPEEALGLLLQQGKVYRAIDMNIRLQRWEAALDLAQKHKGYVDVVLSMRHKFLQDMNYDETNPKFIKATKEVSVDHAAVAAKIAAEEEKDRRQAEGN